MGAATVGGVVAVLKVIFTVSAGIGMLFLFVGPIGAAVAASDGVRGRALRRVPGRTVADLRSVKDQPRRVVVRGTSVPGAEGELTAPLSGTSCVWYRLTLYRIDTVRTESGDELRYVRVRCRTSGEVVWFDDGTGAVPVDVEVLEKLLLDRKPGPVESTRKDDYEPGRTGRFELVEELVRAGVTMTVFARPAHHDGQLVLVGGRGHRVGVTALTHAEVADHLAGEAREGWWGVRAVAIIGVTALLCGLGGLALIR